MGEAESLSTQDRPAALINLSKRLQALIQVKHWVVTTTEWDSYTPSIEEEN